MQPPIEKKKNAPISLRVLHLCSVATMKAFSGEKQEKEIEYFQMSPVSVLLHLSGNHIGRTYHPGN